jgi:hypothetical protein
MIFPNDKNLTFTSHKNEANSYRTHRLIKDWYERLQYFCNIEFDVRNPENLGHVSKSLSTQVFFSKKCYNLPVL